MKPGVGGVSRLDEIRNVPANLRLFYGHLWDLMNRSFNGVYATDWAARYILAGTGGMGASVASRETLLRRKLLRRLGITPAQRVGQQHRLFRGLFHGSLVPDPHPEARIGRRLALFVGHAQIQLHLFAGSEAVLASRHGDLQLAGRLAIEYAVLDQRRFGARAVEQRNFNRAVCLRRQLKR